MRKAQHVFDFLEPLPSPKIQKWQKNKHGLAKQIQFFTEDQIPDLAEVDLVVVGVRTPSYSGNEWTTLGPDSIRERLYELYPSSHFFPVIADLGNLLITPQTNALVQLEMLLDLLFEAEKTVIILGGGANLQSAIFQSHKKFFGPSHLLNISPKIPFSLEEKTDKNNQNYLDAIFLDPQLHDYTHLAYQQYLVPPAVLRFIEKKNWNFLRWGELTQQSAKTEPLFRNAQIVGVDISSVRASEAPACAQTFPNGLQAEVLCKWAHYAGISDKVRAFGFYELNPFFDHLSGMTSMLAAQVLWCFLEGYFQRMGDFPAGNLENYTRYCVSLEEDLGLEVAELIFYHNSNNQRWWVEMPWMREDKSYQQHVLSPCQESDYSLILKGILSATLQQKLKKRVKKS